MGQKIGLASFMINALKPIFALMLGSAIFLMGNGLQTTLVPLAGSLTGLSDQMIGIIGSLYFVGFAAGCVAGPFLLQRVGHVQAYGAMTALAGGAAVLYGLAAEAALWAILRMATGFAFAILYMVIESWLNEIASNKNRGTIFATYTFLNLTVVTAGQSMIVLADPAGPALFAVNAGLITLAALPVLLSKAPRPAAVVATRLRLGNIFKASPAGVAGAVAVGLANGAFWSLAPNYGLQSGLDVDGIAIFMAVGVLAGALGQIPLGRLSDARDRRQVIALAAFAAAGAGLFLGVFANSGMLVMLGIAAFGFFAFPLYAVSVAHVNDRVTAGNFVEASGAMLLLYSGGAILGPSAASALMEALGARYLFVFTALVYGVLGLWVVMRIAARTRVAEAEQEDFVVIPPRVSPTAVLMDPRVEESDLPDELLQENNH